MANEITENTAAAMEAKGKRLLKLVNSTREKRRKQDAKLAAAAKKVRQTGAVNLNVDGHVTDTGGLPDNREFRDAWQLDGTAIVIDMAKARVIHRGAIEDAKRTVARDAIEREIIMGENIDAVRVMLTASDYEGEIAAAETPEELHAIWPEGLARP